MLKSDKVPTITLPSNTAGVSVATSPSHTVPHAILDDDSDASVDALIATAAPGKGGNGKVESQSEPESDDAIKERCYSKYTTDDQLGDGNFAVVYVRMCARLHILCHIFTSQHRNVMPMTEPATTLSKSSTRTKPR